MTVSIEQNSLVSMKKEISEKNEIFNLIRSTPGFSKIPAEGIWAVMNMASSLGINYTEAFNGGLYYVKGKVEMSARLMNMLIRFKGHSISKDPRSDEKICILHGKRSDNGDTWSCKFTIEEAQRAGLLINNVWKAYPEDMLFARALSRLARQLFPDIIGGCYVEGEIKDGINIDEKAAKKNEMQEAEITLEKPRMTEAKLAIIKDMIGDRDDYKQRILVSFNVQSLEQLPDDSFGVIKNGIETEKRKEMRNAEINAEKVANENH